MNRDYQKWRKQMLSFVPRETTINNFTNNLINQPMTKTKFGSWLSSRDWRGLADFFIKWLLVPATATGTYLAHSEISNLIDYAIH